MCLHFLASFMEEQFFGVIFNLSVVLVFELFSMPSSVLLGRLFTSLSVTSLPLTSLVFRSSIHGIADDLRLSLMALERPPRPRPTYLHGVTFANVDSHPNTIKCAFKVYEYGRLSTRPCDEVRIS